MIHKKQNAKQIYEIIVIILFKTTLSPRIYMQFYKIYIELSDICNLQCSFCTPKKALRGIMPLDLFTQIIKQIKNKTKLLSLHVLGDPLCINNLREYLLVTQKYHLKLDIVSSGIYLEQKHFDMLCQDNIHQISFSLDSFFDTNNQKTIATLHARNKSITKTQYFDRIFALYEYLQAKSCKTYLNLRLFGNYDYRYILECFPEFIQQDSKRRIRLARNFFLRFHKKFAWIPPKYSNIAQPQALSTNKALQSFSHTPMQENTITPYCLGSIRQLGILANGVVVPCCIDAQGIMQLGDLRTQKLQDILQSEVFLNFQKHQRLAINLTPMCQKCSFRGV